KVYTLVADYAPGIDSETAFKKEFEARGGQVVDSVRVPLRNPDFAPFVQRIKDAKPEAVFMFVPAGEQSIAFMKAFEERGLGNDIDGDKAMEILKGMQLTSPRGPIAIDPATRDIVQTVYIRRVEKRGNEYWNIEFDKFDHVKDPGK